MAKRDYYAVLGLKRSASDEDIRRAFRELARKHHPDLNRAPDAQARFVEIQEAYDVLSDPEKRAAYDRFGHAGPASARPAENADSGLDDFSAMVDAIFGRRGGSPFAAEGSQGRRSRAQHTRHEIEIDFLTGVTGGSRTLEIARSGSTQAIQVTIPPGIAHGAKLRVRGVGHADPADPGSRSDLILTVSIRPHPVFRRGEPGRGEQDRDVYLDLPVTIAEAALGATVEIPTPTGRAELSVPPGAASGRRLRLRGQGCQSTPPGDLYAVIMIQPPLETALTPEAREQLTRLGEATPVRTGSNWPSRVSPAKNG
jgi:curved DNA-binding protein